MQPTLPVTIRKSFIGLFAIYLVGFLLTVALLGAGLYLLLRTDSRPLGVVLLAVAAFTVLGTLVQGYVYSLCRIVLTEAELDVINWSSLFSQNNAVCEWRMVNDVDFKKAGILSFLFDYGTLLVQTAGTERNLRISYVPRVEKVRDLIAQLADTAITPVRSE
ncbi:MAG TPA: hypothetical protein VFH39_04540 [Candidatus Saccharimonadales bacterium]|nr:hypothetical protein [Candidatus Saccharimonadales bacterium]